MISLLPLNVLLEVSDKKIGINTNFISKYTVIGRFRGIAFASEGSPAPRCWIYKCTCQEVISLPMNFVMKIFMTLGQQIPLHWSSFRKAQEHPSIATASLPTFLFQTSCNCPRQRHIWGCHPALSPHPFHPFSSFVSVFPFPRLLPYCICVKHPRTVSVFQQETQTLSGAPITDTWIFRMSPVKWGYLFSGK